MAAPAALNSVSQYRHPPTAEPHR